MNFDELNEYYNKGMQQAQQQMNNLQGEKEAAINAYETGYNTQLNEYNDLQAQQQNYIDTWAATQKEQQQKQTDYNIGLINQNKEKAAEETQKQTQDAYVDYMKQTNQYGGALENLASRGLATQGYAESSKVAMYNTYQNRVATANKALMEANTQYDNQIQQAQLTNDAALAEFALQQMEQSYKLALDGFNFRNDLYNQRLNYLQNIDNLYYERANNLQSMQNAYAGELGKIRQYQDEIQLEREKRELARQQWEREFAEEQRQFNASLSQKYASSGPSNYNYDYDYSGGDSSETKKGANIISTPYYNDVINPDVQYGTFNTKDSNGVKYQPDNINGVKLIKTGEPIEIATKTLNGETRYVKQNIWQLPDGTNWYWDGRQNKYIKYTGKNVPKIVTGEEIDRLQKILNS